MCVSECVVGEGERGDRTGESERVKQEKERGREGGREGGKKGMRYQV